MEQQSASIFKHSQERIDYVNRLSIEELKDRYYLNAMYQADLDVKNISKCIVISKEDFRNDKEPGSNFYGWQSNIAMAFKDEFRRYAEEHEIEGTALNFNIHEISNTAAVNFLNILCSENQ